MATPAEVLIQDKLRRQGRMTFAAFMEMALYAPGAGYYTAGEPGRDFYTSPAAHPAFGSLVGLQLDQMWRLLGCPHPFTVVELGGGRGLLARDILDSPLHPPSLEATRHLILERGPASPSFGRASTPCAQVVLSRDIPLKGVVGCFLANELWDAFPVHRVVMSGGRLKEVFVALDGDRLAESLGEPSTPDLQAYLGAQGISLEEGEEAAVNLGLSLYLAQLTRSLEAGFVLTIDYGAAAGGGRGSLRCYYRHQAHADPYVHIGGQDITCSVDFPALIRAGEAAGLTTLGFTTQRQFLLNLGLGVLLERLASAGLPSAESHAEALALHDLIRPDGLGDFRVLIQGKPFGSAQGKLFGSAQGKGECQLDGLLPDNPTLARLRDLKDMPLPHLTPGHAQLLQARYPHLAWTPPEGVG